jgi:hypothetical protein
MKKFLMVCCGVLFLQAVNALGQTNAAPAGRQPVSRGQSQGEKGASKLKNATPSVAPPQGSFRLRGCDPASQPGGAFSANGAGEKLRSDAGGNFPGL